MPYQTEMFSDDDSPKNKALPFVKWAGGKRSVAPQISQYLPENIEVYHEPFVGGGAVFFAYEHLIRKAALADVNEELILAYRVIMDDVDNLIEVLQNHGSKHSQASKKERQNYYYQVRDKQEQENSIDAIARFLYLNKTCFNGLYRVNKSGRFNTPIGKYENPKICDPANLKKVAETLQKVDLKVGDFSKTISPQRNDFVYCDPPYDETFTGYHSKGFEKEDQKRLKSAVDEWKEQGALIMISNSDTEFIRELYKDYRVLSVTAQRNINCDGKKRGQTPEVLITSYE